jgi:trehalose 6-phosphate synthase
VADDLVIVSHRGPVQFRREAGRITARRNAGGLVTALSDLVRHAEDARWICAASSDADREHAGHATWFDAPLGAHSCRVKMLDVEPDTHHDFYAVIANPLLWFVQHSLWDHATAPEITRREHEAWTRGYVAVNRSFARAVCDSTDNAPGSTVMVHDYHFYLVPELVRAERPDLFVHSFVHIPWPQADAWRVLPEAWRIAIFEGLLGSDIVAFHTERYVRNFLGGCRELLGLDVDFRHSSVRVDGREVAVRHYPISIDVSSLEETATGAEARHHRRELASNRPEHVILRVDRTDPSKNIVRGFRAFGRLLELHPELHGHVVFRALLQPSRQDVPQYAAYLREIEQAAAAVNAAHGSPSWTPVDLQLGDDFARTVAAYCDFDVLMVNPVADGMNLVAKEALVVNECNGVLVLSENAGAHDELGAVAVTVHPFDIEQQAHALHAAITMPLAERTRRREAGAHIVRTNDVRKWLERQLWDIELMHGPQATAPAPRPATR